MAGGAAFWSSALCPQHTLTDCTDALNNFSIDYFLRKSERLSDWDIILLFLGSRLRKSYKIRIHKVVNLYVRPIFGHEISCLTCSGKFVNQIFIHDLRLSKLVQNILSVGKLKYWADDSVQVNSMNLIEQTFFYNFLNQKISSCSPARTTMASKNQIEIWIHKK